MTPLITSVGFAPVQYPIDILWPVQPTIPSQAVGVGAALGAVSNPWGQDDNTFSMQAGSFSGGGSSAGRTTGGLWALVTERVGAGTGNSGMGQRLSGWSPALDPATCPTPDDLEQRIFWLQVELLIDAAETQSTIADSLGVGILPDDGLAFSSLTWPIAAVGAAGGFGVFKRAANDGWRYASYGAGGVLLEAQNLAPATAGWHVIDFIIRQARFGDLTTPWLTVRYDGSPLFTERVFGHALLPTPQSLRATAHGWAFLYALIPTAAGRASTRSRYRVGAFHPLGYPQP